MTQKAWAIFGPRRQQPHLDKIMATPAECWGLLCDELDKPLTGVSYSITEMRHMGYSCRKIKISWRKCARTPERLRGGGRAK